MTTISETGFDRTRLDEILANLQNSIIAIFGSEIVLSPDTIDGQTLGIFAESLDNLTMLAEDVYHSFNPQTAKGVALSRLVQLNGVRRIAGAYSEVQVTLTGTEGTLIPSGSLVKNPTTNDVYQTTLDVTIDDTGSAVVTARALTYGAILAPINTVTKIDNPVYGWQSVTNAVATTPGRLEETDEELRIRRLQSTSTPAQSLVDALRGALLNIPQVTQSVVLENYSDVTDSNGILPHSIHAIVQGGLNQTIADTIWALKSLGCGLMGSTSVNVIDLNGGTNVVKFSRPTPENIYVTVNVVQKAGWPSTGADDIKNNIVNWAIVNQSIGEEVIQSRIYEPVNQVPGHSVTSLFIGITASPTGTSNLAIAFNELASFDVSRIVVNVT